MNNIIDNKLKLIPHKPGCYLMKNIDGNIIYVGKSKNLKNRVTSYFKSSHTGKTKKLVSEIYDFEYIITSTEVESLVLELNLIKKYDPKYNILLRDDKTYPYIELTNEKVPRLVVVRNPNIKRNRKNTLYGPFPNVTAARNTVELINRLYPLRKCRTYSKKACLYYHINECLGYCVNKISDDVINQMKEEITSFLSGNSSIITNKIKEKMEICSNNLNFEKALEYKTMLDNINITLEKQKVELDDNINRDVISYYYEGEYISISILFIRGGKLLDKYNKVFPLIGEVSDEVNSFIYSFYDKHSILPKEVLVCDDIDTVSLSSIFQIKFINPKKGIKRKIVDLTTDNAKNAYHEKLELIKKDEEQTSLAMNELGKILGINNLSRVEIFDNSNLFGNFNVSGMVVFIDGKPYKEGYRKWKIMSDMSDDYNTMREVIYRRYFRVLKDKLVKPDLIIVDGGVGQINVALEVLESLCLDIPIVGLKKDDNHRTNALVASKPIREIPLDKTSNLFHLLTRMQEEVHNYTINYHKKIRSKGALSSILDNIPGIGEVRKKELLKKYKTINKMKECSIEELMSILPKNVAENFYQLLKEME